METKCTQTKLDDEEAPLFLPPPNQVAVSNTQSADEPIKAELQNDVTTIKTNRPAEIQPIAATITTTADSTLSTAAGCSTSADSATTVGTTTTTATTTTTTTADATESKGEIGTWTSSTEVCPWEDE